MEVLGGIVTGYGGGLQGAGKCPGAGGGTHGVLEGPFSPIWSSTASRKPSLSASLTVISAHANMSICSDVSHLPRPEILEGRDVIFWVSCIFLSPVPHWMPDTSRSSIEVWWINEIWWDCWEEESDSKQDSWTERRKRTADFHWSFAGAQRAIQKCTLNRCLKVRKEREVLYNKMRNYWK